LRVTSSNLARWSGIVALLAGLIFLVIVLLNSQESTDVSSLRRQGDVVLVLFIVALLGEMAGIAGLHALQRGRYGQLGATGALLAFVAIASQLVGIVGIELVGVTSSAGTLALALLVVLSAPALFGGLVFLGVATLRARVLPSWFGVLLIVGLFVAVILLMADLMMIGVLAYGGFWIVVGYMLFRAGKGGVVGRAI
jgi:hypothetical protein